MLDRSLCRSTVFVKVPVILCFLVLLACRTTEVSHPQFTDCALTPELLKANICAHSLKSDNCLLRLHDYTAPKEILEGADADFEKMNLKSVKFGEIAEKMKGTHSAVESKSISYYTTQSGYRAMNAALRGDPVKWEANQNMIYAAASGMNKIARYTGETFRTEHVAMEELSSLQKTFKPGNLVVEKGFLSTSIDEDFAYEMATASKLQISYKINSKSGRSLRSFTFFPHEQEVLFLPGSVFRVVHADFEIKEIRPHLELGGSASEKLQHIEIELDEIEI